MIATAASDLDSRSLKPNNQFEPNIKLSRPKDDPNGKVVLARASTQTSTSSPIPADLQPAYYKLYAECQEHATYFAKDHTEYGQRLHAAHIAWQDFIVLANRLVLQIQAFAHEYDFDANTPGNGYRSFIYVTNACITYGLNISQQLVATRATIFFRKKFYMKEVEACSQLLCSICTCLQYLLILRQWSVNTGDLLANGRHTAEQLFELGDTINQYCFYGRCLGFQYGDSIRGVLRFLGISMASYSETYYSQTDNGSSTLLKTTRSLWSSGKYLMNPELRARRIVNISQNAKIDFCKSFWFLAESELMHKIPSIVGSSIKVNRVIQIPAEPMRLPARVSLTGDTSKAEVQFVDIPIPSAHLGPGLPVSVRLLSARRRAGMLGEGRYRGWRRPSTPSKSILFHCHGGGFVAQSSKSHELYLRDWAVALDVPILSVDYSLAPEAPFPRALQEVYYAYCWLLNNAEYLGTTAERVICAGDSAGANLSIGLALKCIEQNVRIPDGLFLAYCPTLVSFVPSPARMLCLMDPLLPFGFMMRCLRAYAAPSTEMLKENAKHLEHLEEIRKAQPPLVEIEKLAHSISSSRRTSTAKSPLTPLEPLNRSDEDESSDTFASASYHSQTVERTDLPSTDNSDNSSCVSFEDDSQPIEHYPIEISAEMPKDPECGAYIDSFLDKYLIDMATVEATEDNTAPTEQLPLANGHDKTNSEENILIEAGREIIVDTLPGRLQEAVNNIINRCTQSYEIHGSANLGHQDVRNLDALIARSPSEEFAFEVPKDPFLSPYWASDEWLSQLPETRIITLNMDPCLDDCVMLAKKLKRLGRQVHLDILEGLPHGFLNFTMLSNEAMDGSKECIKSLKILLQSNSDNNEDSLICDRTSSPNGCSSASAAP